MLLLLIIAARMSGTHPDEPWGAFGSCVALGALACYVTGAIVDFVAAQQDYSYVSECVFM
jgi:hypothetical protein